MKNQYLISSSFLTAAALSLLPHFSKDTTAVINSPTVESITSKPLATKVQTPTVKDTPLEILITPETKIPVTELKDESELKNNNGVFTLPDAITPAEDEVDSSPDVVAPADEIDSQSK